MSKKLVAFFSAGGRTAITAGQLAKAIGADICEIEPTVPYTREDLYWPNEQCRSIREMKTPGIRQEMKPFGTDPTAYDVIFIGFPVWCNTIPTIIESFLTAYDFSGKTIIPFATSGGGGMGRSERDIQLLAPKAKVFGSKLLTYASPAAMEQWAEGLGV